MEANLRAQLAENVAIIFGKSKSKKGGHWEYRLSHENLLAYSDMYRAYLSLKEQEQDWSKDHPDDTDSGSKKLMTVYERMLDNADYFFTIKTKLWLLSLTEDERKDMHEVLEQLNNETFWKTLFNWRRMAKELERTESASPLKKQEDEVSQHDKG